MLKDISLSTLKGVTKASSDVSLIFHLCCISVITWPLLPSGELENCFLVLVLAPSFSV